MPNVPKTPANAKVAQNDIPDPLEVGKLHGGDYTVHVFIESVKEIDIPEGDHVEALFKVDFNSKKQFSQIKKEITNRSVLQFHEHMFFELTQQTPAQLALLKIKLDLNQHCAIKDVLIGSFEMDFSYVYFLDDHTLKHQWFALNNPSVEDFAEVRAYAKVSISITGVDDSPVELVADPTSDDSRAIMPPSIRPKYKQIKIHIFKGQHLPKLDKNYITKGSMDAYFKCTVFKKPLETKVHTTKDDEAEWNETFYIPVQIPIMSGLVKV
jgi:hypothetical protein